MSTNPPTARLCVFLAREAHFGLILRRGPSRHVCAIGWNRADDTFQLGQWIKNKIYEHRSDLSPDGRHFLYFRFGYGGKQNRTAISRTPFLKGIAVWEQVTTYGGGGLFLNNTQFWLNGNDEAQEDFADGLSQIAQPPPPWPWGMSEHEIYYARLQRDGWHLCSGTADFNFPTIWEKKSNAWTLRQFSRYAEEPEGRGKFWQWFQAHDWINNETLGDQNWEWADFDKGRLVWAQGGKLLATRIWDAGHGEIVELANFNEWKFKTIRASY